MSLDKLASEIASLAKAEAKMVTDAAAAEAKSIGAAAGEALLHGGELLRRDAHSLCNKKPRPECRGRGA